MRPAPGSGAKKRSNLGAKMRVAVAFTLIVSASVAAYAQGTQRPPVPTAATTAATPQATPTPAPARAPATAAAACANPDAIGLARTVEIDTTGGPGFGFEHFKQHDFLRLNEVMLTFDDGPWPEQHGGRTQGAGRPLHQGHLLPDRQARDLVSRNPEAGRGGRAHDRLPHLVAAESAGMPAAKAKEEIEKGVSAVAWRWASRSVLLPLPGPEASAGAASRISANAISASSPPIWTRSTSRCGAPSR